MVRAVGVFLFVRIALKKRGGGDKNKQAVGLGGGLLTQGKICISPHAWWLECELGTASDTYKHCGHHGGGQGANSSPGRPFWGIDLTMTGGDRVSPWGLLGSERAGSIILESVCLSSIHPSPRSALQRHLEAKDVS